MNINWQRLALNLRRHTSLQAASKKLGRNKGWLGQISRGEINEPWFSDGIRLLDLYHDLAGKDKMKELLRK